VLLARARTLRSEMKGRLSDAGLKRVKSQGRA